VSPSLVTESFALSVVALSEHLLRLSRRRTLEPIESRMKAIVRKALRVGRYDPERYLAVTKQAYEAGARLAAVQLRVRRGTLGEAKRKRKPYQLPRLPDPVRTAAMADQEIDWEDLDHSPERVTTIAEYEVSRAFHNGMMALAQMWHGGDNPVEKHWDAQPDACDECAPNEADGWIDFEAPFGSGDFEPPLHPNCRCSLSLREADDSEAA
jgi:hypothetical protein